MLTNFVPRPRVQVLPPFVSPELGSAQDPQGIVLCHYSMQVWDLSNQGSWHLFGHSHGRRKGIGLSFDAGVNCTDFTPLSLERVASKLAQVTAFFPGSDHT
jgi:hypothetical protein